MQRRWMAGACLALAALGGAMGAFAQDKPPLKIVVGFPPGGSADTLARLLAEALRNDFQQVIVENRPGAGGRIALQQVRRAAPDGHTVIVLPSGPMVLFPHVYKKLDYDAVADFTPVSLLARFQFGVVAGPASTAKTVKDMITQAKAQASLLRAQSLGRNVSLVALEDANSALESASQEVDRLTALLDQARIQLSRYTIMAPIAGTIMSIAADPGQIVDPASPILTVADLRALMVETDVDEAYATQISQGLKAVLQLVGTNQNLAGTVSFVSPQVDVTTGGLAVRISTDLPLKAPVGLTVTANIIVEDNPAAISAPRTALVTDATGSSVFVLRDGKAKITPVQPVDWPAARLIVTEGLRAGDLLIEDASGLQDGQEVAVTGDAASAAQSSVGQTPSTKDIPLPIDK